MALPKHKKIKRAVEVVEEIKINYPSCPFVVRITVNSDSNVLEHTQIINGEYEFKFIKSDTNMGKLVTFSPENLQKFLIQNAIIQPIVNNCNDVAKITPGLFGEL